MKDETLKALEAMLQEKLKKKKINLILTKNKLSTKQIITAENRLDDLCRI